MHTRSTAGDTAPPDAERTAEEYGGAAIRIQSDGFGSYGLGRKSWSEYGFEVGRVIALNEKPAAAWQPLQASVSES
jgi:hypothetical protein